MVPLLAMILALVVPASAGTPATSEIADARAMLPDPRLSKDQYVRYYLRATIRSDEDLPFTTSGSFSLAAPRAVWLGVYVRTPSIWTNAPAGIHVVATPSQFPEFVHGGCAVVNIVADAETGETLGSWCNIDDGPPLNGMPTPLPSYFPVHSPLR
jgi:hypothetical protein